MSDHDAWDVDPAGPGPFVWEFARWTLDDRDLRSAWLAVDDTLRLAMAQRFLYGMLGPQTIADADKRSLAQEDAEALARAEFDHPLWPAFEQAWSDELDRTWPGGIDIDQWAYTTAPRPIGPDLEHAIIMDTGGRAIELAPGEAFHGKTVNFLVRRTAEGWKVASTSTQLPEPGWPPEWHDTDAAETSE